MNKGDPKEAPDEQSLGIRISVAVRQDEQVPTIEISEPRLEILVQHPDECVFTSRAFLNHKLRFDSRASRDQRTGHTRTLRVIAWHVVSAVDLGTSFPQSRPRSTQRHLISPTFEHS